MKAAQVVSTVGGGLIRVNRVSLPVAKAGEVVVRNAVAGLNFIDTYKRNGMYPVEVPMTLGEEGAGEVVAIGQGVDDKWFAGEKGKRVAYFSTGSYAEFTAVKAERVVQVPENISLETAVALMTQGLTAHYLATSTFALGKQHTCLVHAAGGGTGQLLVQIAKLRGAKVIGTSSAAKVPIGLRCGADVMLAYDELTQDEIVKRVRDLTQGIGVDVVYDGLGKTTHEMSARCIRQRGLLVLFGNATGKVPPIDPLSLAAQGSLFLTRPTLQNYIGARDELVARCEELFSWTTAGKLRAEIDRRFPLQDIAKAHEYIEAGKTKGKVLIAIQAVQ